ncbi:MAG: helix-turn-helix transcriptional regulator [Clostridia bacterium]|nr:helix-turn-helix transcriptional regulator [Clostridia bacterium]
MQTLYSYKNEGIEIAHRITSHLTQRDTKYHSHNNLYEVFCFVDGEAEYIVEDSVYPLKPGYLLIMRPGERHKIKIHTEKGYERFFINFSENILSSYNLEKHFLFPFTDRNIGKKNLYFPTEFPQFTPKDIFSRMCLYSDCSQEKRISAYLYILLEGIYNAFIGKRHSDESTHYTAERMIMYISEHLSEDLSLASLSEKFFLSPSQINRIFKKSAGVPIGEYILTKRLTAAEDLLRNGTSALDACQKCGFRDYSAFYRSYRKRVGRCPRDDMTDII